MADYVVEPKSRKELRHLANLLRRRLGLEKALWIPIVEILDVLGEVFSDFSFEIVPDRELSPGIHAETNIKNGHITIRESVYERACDGEGRDRMTIAHEIAHFFTVCYCGFRLQRNFSRKAIPAFIDPEWQAKCFAGEFMISSQLTKNMSTREIVKQCGVSWDAAEYQIAHRE